MSLVVAYEPSDEMNFNDLFSGVLEDYDIEENIDVENTSRNLRVLTNGNYNLWCRRSGRLGVEFLLDTEDDIEPVEVIEAIQEEFGVELLETRDAYEINDSDPDNMFDDVDDKEDEFGYSY